MNIARCMLTAVSCALLSTTAWSTVIPDIVCVQILPDRAGDPSYLDTRIFVDPPLLLDTWCVDTERRIRTSFDYTARVYTLDDPEVADLFDREDAVDNLDLVLYIINAKFPGTLSESDGIFTSGDVQRAIWELVENRQSTGALGEWSQLRADEIVADALENGRGYFPGCDDLTLVFLKPVLAGCDLDTELDEPMAQIIAVEMPVECATIGDFVWFDANGNGIQDELEPGIPGVRVELLDCVGNLLDFTFTDDEGLYFFTDLLPGNYRIRVVPPEGFQFTIQNAGDDPELDSDADASGYMACTTLGPGDVDLSWDAGLVLAFAAIGDYVWFDANGNGIQDEDEFGVPDVEVLLLDCEGKVLDWTFTDGEGFYSFTGLMPGAYNIQVIAPPGFAFTIQNAGDDPERDSDADANGVMACVILEPGDIDLSWDAGLVQLPMNPGTGTPGYWANHPHAWPVDFITVGGITYSKEEARSRLLMPVRGDVTIILFRALVCAKLNVIIGNDASCIADIIAAADAWLALYGPVGSNVRGSSHAWRIGEPLYEILDAYNNGLLCAPSRK